MIYENVYSFPPLEIFEITYFPRFTEGAKCRIGLGEGGKTFPEHVLQNNIP